MFLTVKTEDMFLFLFFQPAPACKSGDVTGMERDFWGTKRGKRDNQRAHGEFANCFPLFLAGKRKYKIVLLGILRNLLYIERPKTYLHKTLYEHISAV